MKPVNSAMASRAEEFARFYLSDEIQAIVSSERMNGVKELDAFEKAIIYKYSTDGYIDVNEHLRESNGSVITEFGLLLDQVLEKLPNFKGLVFRRAQVPREQLKKYKRAFKNDTIVTEPCFISTSKIKTYILLYPGNVVFRVSSKSNSNFRVLGITKEHDYTLITLEEE